MLAQYVLTGLQGDMGAGVTADKVEQWFPVVARQAATITNFHSTIIARSGPSGCPLNGLTGFTVR